MGPLFLRTILASSAWGEGKFGYVVAEYNLSTGSWKKIEISMKDTKMRIEQDGQQFESNTRGWELCPKELWMKDFDTFLAVRKLRGYTGEYPEPKIGVVDEKE